VGTVVIVGAGQAGIETATALRRAGHQGPIVVFGEEPGLPYARPPLSKAYLVGEADAAALLLRKSETYDQQDIQLRPGTRVAAIDTAAHAAVLDDGQRLRYDHLVLATGGDPRVPDTPGLVTAANVHTLRTLDDATALRARLAAGSRVAIIGGGYIGLEIAAAARTKGLHVSVVEAAPRVLARVTSPVVSEFFHRVHAEEGVEILVDAAVAEALTDDAGDVRLLRLTDGRELEVDFVLVGVGLIPRTQLAEAAGLLVDNGIVVDDAMRTSVPDIYAIGDVARHPDPQQGGSRRLESIPNASEQARCVAATITGSFRPYTAVPWFWSDQYDLKLQTAGLASGYDSLVVRGDATAGRQLTVLYLQGEVVIAADVVNKPADFAAAKRLISARVAVDPEELADSDRPLKSFVGRAAPTA
jgi:3-phenylpropionate/trans-cinnamate dioxygenase ferredoxin reductase subunit